jgi:hypothetical protein
MKIRELTFFSRSNISDILGLLCAFFVFTLSFFAISPYIFWVIKSIEFIGIFLAGIAILLIRISFKRRIKILVDRYELEGNARKLKKPLEKYLGDSLKEITKKYINFYNGNNISTNLVYTNTDLSILEITQSKYPIERLEFRIIDNKLWTGILIKDELFLQYFINSIKRNIKARLHITDYKVLSYKKFPKIFSNKEIDTIIADIHRNILIPINKIYLGESNNYEPSIFNRLITLLSKIFCLHQK